MENEEGKKQGFTPGPWIVIGQDIFGTEPDEYICMWSGRSANAALIAAAPEMYYSLESLIELWSNWASNSPCLDEPLKRSIEMRVEEARKALDKANGKI